MQILRFTLPILVLLVADAALAAEKAVPPIAKDLVGVGIGFGECDLDFIPLERHRDSACHH
jgi:hypothetical protein